MLAEERKAREVVVEALAIESEDVGVTSFVLGVAVRARRPDDLGRAVKSGALAHIGRYLSVAVETEVLLLRARETHVTGRARCFRVGVRG
jgi:hypothetical protein